MILRGARVALRPFREEELAVLVERGIAVAGSDTPEAHARLRAVVTESGDWDEHGFLRFAVESDGRLVGDVQARRPPRALPPGVCELGINLFETADRGRGLGREAIALFVDHLFSDAEMGRVQLSTDVENAAMRRVATGVGFREEGVMRGFMPGEDGARADYVLYGVTREEWLSR